MIIKQGLKFLNTLSFGLENKKVFSTGQTHQINRAVVATNPVQVVNNPTLRQWLAVSLLPDKKMFCHIALTICSRMFGFKELNIPMYIGFATTPVCPPFPAHGFTCSYTCSPLIFGIAMFAPNSLSVDKSSAVNTRVSVLQRILSFKSTLAFYFSFHSLILTYLLLRCKQSRNQIKILL